MKQFQLMYNSENKALLLISRNSSDLRTYESTGYECIKTGNKRELLSYIDDFWDENLIPEDERIFLKAA